MLKMRHNPNITKLFRGFRVGKKPFLKLNLKYLEKQNMLTDQQQAIAEFYLSKCTETTDPAYVARICAVLDKLVIKAKVNQLGNPIEEKEPEKKEEVTNEKPNS